MSQDVLDVYLREAERVDARIQAEIAGVARYASAAVVVVAIGTLLRLEGYDRQAALIGAPFVLAWVLGYSFRRLKEMSALGGYKAHLERQINGLLGRNVVTWESGIAGRVFSGSHSDRFLWVALGVTMLTSSFASFRATLKYEGEFEALVTVTIVVAAAFFTVMLTLSARDAQRVRTDVVTLAKELGAELPPTIPEQR